MELIFMIYMLEVQGILRNHFWEVVTLLAPKQINKKRVMNKSMR